MKPATYQHFRDLIYREGGIELGPNKQMLLAGRIGRRLVELRLQSPDDYYRRVMHDDSGRELVQLLDAIATNHTFFFREAEHFGVLRSFLTQRLQAGQRRFRIWCAAASSGEEPYSLAMYLLELFDELSVAVDFKLLATDLSTKALSLAETGWYSPERCQAVPQTLKSKYFETAVQDGQPGYQVGQRLREVTLFRRLNLIEFPYPQRGPLDAIFCRNVMIYFDEATRRRIVSAMQRLLGQDSLLFVGMTESILGMHGGYEYVSPSVYRRSLRS